MLSTCTPTAVIKFGRSTSRRILADYYAQADNWNGVDAVLQSELGTQAIPVGMGMGQGRGFGQGQQNANNGMMAGMDHVLIPLADEKVL